MTRSLALGLIAAIVGAPAFAQSSSELTQTGAFIAGLQNADGGFGGTPGAASNLGSTSSAIRTLKFVGGSIPNVPACVEYVKRCSDGASGGFAPEPGGKPDVHTTAIGLMAVAELKLPAEEYVPKAIAFLHENVKSFEDMRIAVAGLEAVNAKSADFGAWAKLAEADRNADGAWGAGTNRARATGGAAVALLRMGIQPTKLSAVVQAIRAGQNADGGWSEGDGKPSDLSSSYRVMRCFFMLKEKPDLDRLAGFLARHRQSDGGFAPGPGKPSDLGSTYTASIMRYWSRQLGGEPALVESAGFAPLFNGHDLTGWQGDPALWKAKDGMLVGVSPGLKHNDFLATEKSYGDFVLKLSFRLKGDDKSNSGVQFRSVRVPPHEMSGYQADIGNGYWGSLYDESRRNKVLVAGNPKAVEALHKGDWNHYVIRAIGGHITLSLNGVTSVDYQEPDPKIARSGKIAVQIHAGGPMEIQFKDLLIQALPEPVADDALTPGFHLRTAQTPVGERKYTVFIPRNYDPAKAAPLVLFLHGSGERGEDGILPALVGLGPAIARDPEAFPAIAVFPQARRSWSADSDDATAALAVLDDVSKRLKVDPDRVALTGLSMGGAGSWGLAARSPERFCAVAPICGPGRIDTAERFKGLPVWSLVGDADRDSTVLGMRSMIAALKSAGAASTRATEYRGVGHNSWDRAYNDPALIAWLISQRRDGRH